MTVGQQSSAQNALLDALPFPVVREVRPSVALPGEMLSVVGVGFGRAAQDIVGISVGGFPCARFIYEGGNSAGCEVPNPPGGVASRRGPKSVTVRTRALAVSPTNTLFEYAQTGRPRVRPQEL